MKASWMWLYSAGLSFHKLPTHQTRGWGSHPGEQGASWEIVSTELPGQAEE